METKISILSKFFEDSESEFHIREIARLTKINHTTVRQVLNKLVKDELLTSKKEKLFVSYKSIISRKYLNLKLFYNLEKLRESKIIEDLERYYDYPVIILFGSYVKGMDTKNSDIDICIISNINKEFNTGKYTNLLNREVSIHNFTTKKWGEAINKNPHLVNNICNGLVLSGELEVLK